MNKKLTIKQERFAQEYVSLGSASEAYRKVYDALGMTDEAVHVSASRIKAKVRLRIKELQANEAKKYSMTRDDVLKQLFQIVSADPNDIVQVRRESCPYCFEEHRSQPRVDCPKCNGEGKERLYIADTRKLTGAARLLFAGARHTRTGIEVILRDQAAALQTIIKLLGLLERTEEKAAPQPISSIRELTNDPIEAARIYQQIMRGY